MLNLFSETSSFSQPLAFTLLVIFIILLYRWWFAITDTNNSSPPSPPKLPIIGNFHQLGLLPHRTLKALSHRYGPLMLFHFGSVPFLIVSSAEAAREVMKSHDLTFSERFMTTAAKKLMYNEKDIAFAPYGEYWRKVKSVLVINLLSNRRVRSFRAVREEETNSMISNIKQSSSSVLNLSEMFARLTNDVASRVALGRKYTRERKFKELLRELTELLGYFNIGDYIPWLSWLIHVNGMNAKFDKVAKELDNFLDGVIQEHMDLKAKSGQDQNDFVDVLLAIQKENLAGIHLDTISIKALILDMFGAGTETTYTTLEWGMTELLRHPRVMNKLKNEIRGIMGSRDFVTEDDLVEMHYLKAVVKESLRIHPPAPLLPRMARQDVEISGYNIKANTRVLVNLLTVGSDPKCYDRPEEFEPERFMDSVVDYKGKDFELIPFGSGRRICPGYQFAMSITDLALANLVHNFDWEMPSGKRAEDIDMTETSGKTSHRLYPLKVVAIPCLS